MESCNSNSAFIQNRVFSCCLTTGSRHLLFRHDINVDRIVCFQNESFSHFPEKNISEENISEKEVCTQDISKQAFGTQAACNMAFMFHKNPSSAAYALYASSYLIIANLVTAMLLLHFLNL